MSEMLLCWFREGVRLSSERQFWIFMRKNGIQINWSKWISTIRRLPMLCGWRQWDHSPFPCFDWCKAKLVHVRILVAFDNRLGDAAVKEERTGIQWDFNTMLEDLDSADDIALLSSTIMKHLQFKTTKQEDNSAQVGLKLNAKECKVLKVNSKSEGSLNVGNCWGGRQCHQGRRRHSR